MKMRSAIARVLIAGSLLVAVRVSSAETTSWNASSGQSPGPPCWTLFDTSPMNNPVLGSGTMHLGTSSPAEVMYFEQVGTQLSVPGTWTIEAGMRVVAEHHPPGSSRWGAAIGFATGPGRGGVLVIGENELRLWSGFGVAGPAAVVPTTDGMHDYRLEVEIAGAIRVYRDGVLVLSGATIAHSGFGSRAYLYFGDGSGEAASTTEWAYFRHDGAASSCGSVADASPRAPGPSVAFEYPAPNPAANDVLLRIDLPRATQVRLVVFDGAGRRMRMLASGILDPGVHPIRWDLRDDRGAPAPAGLYFARLDAEGRRFTRPIVITR